MTSAKAASEDQAQTKEITLCRSALYGALSLALHHPTSDTLAALGSDKTRAAILQASSLLVAGRSGDERNLAGPLVEDRAVDLVSRAEAWVKTFSSLSLDSLLGVHGRLFGHTPRGAVCPYEAEYGQEGLFQQPQQLASVLGFYRAFGLTVRQIQRERPDHISCELEFLEFLLQKEAYALEHGDDSMKEATHRATRLFLKEHLGRFGKAFGSQLKKQDPEGFFGKAGDLLVDFLTLECRRLGIELGSSQLALRSAEEDCVPMACAGEPDLVQLET